MKKINTSTSGIFIIKEYEMEEVMFSDELPDNLTFPDSSKLFFETVKNKKH